MKTRPFGDQILIWSGEEFAVGTLENGRIMNLKACPNEEKAKIEILARQAHAVDRGNRDLIAQGKLIAVKNPAHG